MEYQVSFEMTQALYNIYDTLSLFPTIARQRSVRLWADEIQPGASM